MISMIRVTSTRRPRTFTTGSAWYPLPIAFNVPERMTVQGSATTALLDYSWTY